ncbi:hypothetical protein SDC9_131380 [bioreactor metagenome]|uniref:Uncharacterized protein n=1 Tax=bioreactor metagenome TaxID=1076179 RepID=A0A645D513_9ZZZZ
MIPAAAERGQLAGDRIWWLVAVQHDGDQGRGVELGLDLMHGLGGQKQQLPRAQCLAACALDDGEPPLQTLNRQFALHLMRRQALACHQHQADHFQGVGLEQCSGLLVSQRSAVGLHFDGNPGLGVGQGHDLRPFSAAS